MRFTVTGLNISVDGPADRTNVSVTAAKIQIFQCSKLKEVIDEGNVSTTAAFL